MLVIILAPLGLWLGKSGVAKALLVSVLLLVLVVELLNSAIEAVFVALMNVIIARTLVLFGQV